MSKGDSVKLVNVRLLQKTLQQEGEDMSRVIQQEQQELGDLRAVLLDKIKQNFVLEGDLKVIDNKIGLLVHNRITVQEVIAHSQGLQKRENAAGSAAQGADDAGAVAMSSDQRKLYSSFFYLLQHEPSYLGRVPSFVNLAQTGPFIQAVSYSLFADQYSSREELLLLSVFRASLQIEFQNSLSMGSLLRGNSAVTKMIREYTRREPGQVYLERVLGEELQAYANSEAPSLEIDWVKVTKKLIVDEETTTGQKSTLNELKETQMQSDPRVQAVIGPRVQLIQDMAGKILGRVLASVNDLPYGVRWLAKQIAVLTKERFPEASREDYATMVGGFVYLRFINPAIVTPDAESYRLVKRALSGTHRRNLILVAKVLQNLSNFVLFGEKEQFMIPLNGFIERFKVPLIEFFEALVDVPELEDHLNVDHQFMGVGTVQTPTIRISLNEIALIHSLVESNIQFVAPDLDDPLRDLVAQLGKAPPQVKTAENAETILPLKAPGTDRGALVDDDAATRQRTYEEAKRLLMRVLQLVDHHAIPFTLRHSIHSILTAAHAFANAADTPPAVAAELTAALGSLGAGLEALERYGLYSREARSSALLVDVAAESENRALFREKVSRDKVRIQRTLERVGRHQEYLESQLESYNQYLQNVRAQQSAGAKDPKKKSKASKGAAAGSLPSDRKIAPVKISHDKLLKDGVIAVSRVPEARRKKTMFTFSSDEPGVVDVAAFYHGFAVDRYAFPLDDLLQLQGNDERIIKTEYIDLDVNLFIHLINKCFANELE